MAKFIFVDQSLRSMEGHHYEYAINLLNAVQAGGYTPIIATHRKLTAGTLFPPAWQVIPCYPHSTYSRHSLYGARGKLPQPVPAKAETCLTSNAIGETGVERSRSLWIRLSALWNEPSRRWQRKGFSDACSKLFSAVKLEEGDHVFFATISEFDFLGLADFFERFPQGIVARWHLQFHFAIFEGRPTEYDAQMDRLAWVRNCFKQALGRAAGKRFFFYNTSLPLVDQYQRLGIGAFSNLPYPINPNFHPLLACDDEIPRPLRVTCGGGFRREQGKQHLFKGLADIWDECFASGEMQLLVQAKPSERSKLRLPIRPADGADSNSASKSPVVIPIDHPLDRDDYVDLIRQTHIGLLMYDSRRYYARRAGVLCELLCAGVPVIVPAGCWLAEQIAEAGFEYLDQVCSNRGQSCQSVLAVGHEGSAAECSRDTTLEAVIPADMGGVVISISRRPSDAGAYLRLSIEQFGLAGQSLATFSQIIGQRLESKPARALWRIDPQAACLRLTMQNAYGDSPIPVDELQVTWLPRSEDFQLGSVGLTAADETHVGMLLREMADHYLHYRRTAQEFSVQWRQQHDPRLTAAMLTSSPVLATLHGMGADGTDKLRRVA